MTEPHLTDAERRILACVVNPETPLSREAIGEASNTHPVTVSKTICRLERLGLITVERNKRNTQGGLRSYTKFRVNVGVAS